MTNRIGARMAGLIITAVIAVSGVGTAAVAVTSLSAAPTAVAPDNTPWV